MPVLLSAVITAVRKRETLSEVSAVLTRWAFVAVVKQQSRP